MFLRKLVLSIFVVSMFATTASAMTMAEPVEYLVVDFQDVPFDSVYYEFVEDVVLLEYFKGYEPDENGNKYFGVSDVLTNEQSMVFLYRMVTGDMNGSQLSDYPDMLANDNGNALEGYTNGVLSSFQFDGYNVNFDPKANTTRGDFMLWVGMAMMMDDSYEYDGFWDVKDMHDAYPYVSYAYLNCMVDGVHPGEFDLDGDLKRGPAAKILSNAVYPPFDCDRTNVSTPYEPPMLDDPMFATPLEDEITGSEINLNSNAFNDRAFFPEDTYLYVDVNSLNRNFVNTLSSTMFGIGSLEGMDGNDPTLRAFDDFMDNLESAQIGVYMLDSEWGAWPSAAMIVDVESDAKGLMMGLSEWFDEEPEMIRGLEVYYLDGMYAVFDNDMAYIAEEEEILFANLDRAMSSSRQQGLNSSTKFNTALMDLGEKDVFIYVDTELSAEASYYEPQDSAFQGYVVAEAFTLDFGFGGTDVDGMVYGDSKAMKTNNFRYDQFAGNAYLYSQINKDNLMFLSESYGGLATAFALVQSASSGDNLVEEVIDEIDYMLMDFDLEVSDFAESFDKGMLVAVNAGSGDLLPTVSLVMDGSGDVAQSRKFVDDLDRIVDGLLEETCCLSEEDVAISKDTILIDGNTFNRVVFDLGEDNELAEMFDRPQRIEVLYGITRDHLVVVTTNKDWHALNSHLRNRNFDNMISKIAGYKNSVSYVDLSVMWDYVDGLVAKVPEFQSEEANLIMDELSNLFDGRMIFGSDVSPYSMKIKGYMIK